MSALGGEFRSAREARGLTLSDVAEQIHIRSVYLNAIENEEWAVIGAAVYVRGFIRTYSRFLGLDSEEAVARFNESAPQERPSATAATAATESRRRSGPSIWAIVGGVVAVLLVGFVGYEYWLYAAGNAAKDSVAVATPTAGAVAAGSATPAASPAAAPSTGPALHHHVAIRLTERSWLRVNVDGATKLEGIYPAGTAQAYTGKVAEIRAGNAAGVTVAVNGRPPAAMGKEGDVVEHRYPL